MSGKTIVLTGGKGKLGTSWKAALEKQGANVVVWDLPEVDVSSEESVLAAWTNLPNDIYGVINAAAIDSPPGSDDVHFDRVMKVNVQGVHNVCQALIPSIVKNGAIVNIASMYALVAPFWPKNMAYGASKAAVVQLTREYACECPDVRINSVSFGGVEGDQPDAFKQEYAERCPLGRMARVDEYDDVILFMLTTSYMTGSNLVVDGGWTAW